MGGTPDQDPHLLRGLMEGSIVLRAESLGHSKSSLRPRTAADEDRERREAGTQKGQETISPLRTLPLALKAEHVARRASEERFQELRWGLVGA